MIDDRFSLRSFEALGKDTEVAKARAEQLAREVLVELEPVLRQAFERVVAKLNAIGHQLRPYGEQSPGEVDYRDDYEDEAGYQCRLRLAADLVISTGFAHLYDGGPSCET